MTLKNITVDKLNSAMKNAAVAHHVYEQKLGHPDENWSEWYAKHMLENDLAPAIVDSNTSLDSPFADWNGSDDMIRDDGGI